MPSKRHVLFLQGPICPFFKVLARKLESEGHAAYKINLNLGDQLLWRATNSANFRGRLKQWKPWLKAYLQQNQITDLVLLGEQRDHHRIAIKLAKKAGIQVVVTDFGYLRPDWITFELNGMSAESLFPRNPEEIFLLAKKSTDRSNEQRYEDSFFNQALWDVLYHIAALAGWPLFPGYDNFRRHNPVQDYFGILYRLLSRKRVAPKARKLVDALVESGKKFFVYPLQLQHDYSIQAYSPYSGNEQPMEDILRSFAESAPEDRHLVIKIHPLDPSPFKWKRLIRSDSHRLGISDRVHFLDGGDLHTLLASSQGAVTINSTTGIASLQLGIPTKILGNALYDIEGLVCKKTLDDFWNQPTKPDLALRDAFVKAMAATIQLKGTYYQQPGLNAAVEEASNRLLNNLINQPL